MKERFEAIFKTKTRDEWCALMEGTDICFAPVLSMKEVAKHPHIAHRGTYVEKHGLTQPAPRRASAGRRRSSTGRRPGPGSTRRRSSRRYGFKPDEIEQLRASKAVSG